MRQRDLLGHAVSDVGAGYGIRGSLHCREGGGNAHGRSGLCKTVLLLGSEESEFTQTTV